MTDLLILLAAALATQPAPAAQPARAPLSVAAARNSLLGTWTGKLEYRDYQADKWFGLPVKVIISDGGDGVTLLRTADFDDGPKTGIVRITTVSLLAPDGITETAASFRKGRTPELSSAKLSLVPSRQTDPTHWTMISLEDATDDDRPAKLRHTTTRDGDKLVTLKEVDFTDDAKSEWLTRNRETLRR